MFDKLRSMLDRKSNLSVIAGDPKRAIMYIFWPLLLAQLIVVFNSYFDLFWVSRLGAEQQSAVSAMEDFYCTLAQFAQGLGVACSVSIQFRLGQNNKERANLLASHSIYLSVVLQMALALSIYLLFDPVISLIGVGELRTQCFEYIMPLALCNVIMMVNGALCGILRAEGASADSQIAILLNATSAIFDPIFIYGMDLGVAGAAWGTIAGAVVSTIYVGHLFYHHKTVVGIRIFGIKLDKTAFKELLRIGLPYGFQASQRKFSNIFEASIKIIVAQSVFGTATLAVFAIPWRYIRFLECIGLQFAASLIPVISYNFGRRNFEYSRTAISYTFKKSVTWVTILSVVLIIFQWPLISILTTDPSLNKYHDTMAWILVLAAISAPTYTICDISYGILQSVKKNAMCMIIAYVSLVVKLVFCFVLGYLYGPLWLVVGNVLSKFLTTAIAYYAARYYLEKYIQSPPGVTGEEMEALESLDQKDDRRDGSASASE